MNKINTLDDKIQELNEEQREAVATKKNVIVSAGAGAGKTKTLSARYLRLIVEEGLKVEEILCLTFTNKATIEMKERIYSDLLNFSGNVIVDEALKNFQKANIRTLDSFCNSIVRKASILYGIRPDFDINNDKCYKIAEEVATSFFLSNIKEPVIQELISYSGIRELILDLFVKVLSKYVHMGSPINFEESLNEQKKRLLEKGEQSVEKLKMILEGINKIEDDSIILVRGAKDIITSLLPIPSYKKLLNSDKELQQFLQSGQAIGKLDLRKRGKDITKKPKFSDCKKLIQEFRVMWEVFLNILNFNFSFTKDVFSLLEKLQEEYIKRKKLEGVLSYVDVAHIALDALKKDRDLRTYYQKHIKTIMIDEFQDNNSLQRDLLFLLTGSSPEDLEKGCPLAIPDGKLFFVGDEKQSIYAFRGADVSCFIELKKKLAQHISLSINYRTNKTLIEVFNAIFSYIFYSDINKSKNDPSVFEASFENISYFRDNEELCTGMEVIYVDKIKTEDDKVYLSAEESEAYIIAKRVEELHKNKFKVWDKHTKESRPCNWGDIAILLRSGTRQLQYEKHLKSLGIPYTTSNQKWIFSYAPLNDIYAMFRLAVYPNDIFCYAQVLKSPFVGLSDVGLSNIIIAEKEVFSSCVEKDLSKKDIFLFKKGRRFFKKIQKAVQEKSLAKIVEMLMYDSGYRYLLLSNSDYYVYLELYDYLFHLATLADKSSMSACEFVDLIKEYIENTDEDSFYSAKMKQEMEEMDIPLEQRKDCVKIMSIHKSKGLEFPIVIIPNCENTGKSFSKDGLAFYDKEIGLVLYAGDKYSKYRRDEGRSNFFFEETRDNENKKLVAEVKRLFYVATTRAEQKLILSGVVASNSKDEMKEKKANEIIYPNAKDFIKKMQPKDCGITLDTTSPISFFQILAFALDKIGKTSNTSFSTPPQIKFCKHFPIERKTYKSHKKKEVSIDEKIEEYKSYTKKYFFRDREHITTIAKTSIDTKKDKNFSFETIDEMQEVAMERGEITHQFLEATLHGKEFSFEGRGLSKDEVKEIIKYKDNFISSSLGKKAILAKVKKTEYGFITKYKDEKEKEHITHGVIDLFFEDGDIIYIVDYKTDKKKSDRYKRQLLVYKKALEDIYKLKERDRKIEMKIYLFYLHLNEAVEIQC